MCQVCKACVEAAVVSGIAWQTVFVLVRALGNIIIQWPPHMHDTVQTHMVSRIIFLSVVVVYAGAVVLVIVWTNVRADGLASAAAGEVGSTLAVMVLVVDMVVLI